MLRIQKLGRPNKHSGYELTSGKTTEVRGLVVTNKNSFSVYVDKYTRKKTHVPKKKKKAKPVAEKTAK